MLRRWREETVTWVEAEYGCRQWSLMPFDEDGYARWIENRWTVMAALTPDGEPVATSTLTPHADPGFWTAEQLAVPAAYLRKSTVSRAFAGRGLGSCLRSWMVSCAARQGAEVVRANCWTDNAALLAYHLRQGWKHVGTVTVDTAGVLLEVRAVARDDLPVHTQGEVFLASGLPLNRTSRDRNPGTPSQY
ncbi:GNAT family N-acetyltransferase [Streptomyces uncialis]|uniref:GNAT family N-acetyltransferase n=1 Tax=Streptomyces uncialis TaxID=1048205 RepID=UPI00382254EC